MLSLQTKNKITIYLANSGRCNTWLIYSENLVITVDPGIRKKSDHIIKSAKSILPEGKSTDLLFLTHSHFDHCRCAADLQRKENCKIILGKEEAEYAQQGFSPLPAGTVGFTNFISKFGTLINNRRFHYEPFTPDVLVDREMVIDEELNIKAIKTPGHSAGSISLIINNEFAIVGDVMLGKYDFTIFPPFADHKQELIRSWKKLLETRCRIFLPGHSKPVTRDRLRDEYGMYKKD